MITAAARKKLVRVHVHGKGKLAALVVGLEVRVRDDEKSNTTFRGLLFVKRGRVVKNMSGEYSRGNKEV